MARLRTTKPTNRSGCRRQGGVRAWRSALPSAGIVAAGLATRVTAAMRAAAASARLTHSNFGQVAFPLRWSPHASPKPNPTRAAMA
jgi:hypothetical protein